MAANVRAQQRIPNHLRYVLIPPGGRLRAHISHKHHTARTPVHHKRTPLFIARNRDEILQSCKSGGPHAAWTATTEAIVPFYAERFAIAND